MRTHSDYQSYYVPEQSQWPILASIALFLMAFGAGTMIINMSQDSGGGLGLILLLAGALAMGLILVGWFGLVDLQLSWFSWATIAFLLTLDMLQYECDDCAAPSTYTLTVSASRLYGRLHSLRLTR